MKLNTKPEGALKEAKLNRTSELQNRKSKLDEKLEKIVKNIESERKVDESVKTDFPFTALLSESQRRDFADLSLTDKKKVAQEVKKNPTTDAHTIKALWENVLAKSAVEAAKDTPLWKSAAPKEYMDMFEGSTVTQKASIEARAEFYDLKTQYQIENFWQTSGLNPKGTKTSLNEVFTAKNPKEADAKMNSYVASIGQQMSKWD